MSVKNEKAKYGIIFLGAFILAFGMYNIHARCAITEGGVLGALLLLEHWFDISPALSGPVLDGVCFLIGFKYLGREFLKYSAAASLGFSLFYKLCAWYGPVLPDLSAQPLMAAILGGLFVGVGVGLCVRIGGAAGGDDALAMSVSHMTKLPIERAYLFTDLLVLGMSLTYIPLARILYSLVTVTISSYVIGYIKNYGSRRAKTV